MATKTKTKPEENPLHGVIKLGKRKTIKLLMHRIHQTKGIAKDEHGEDAVAVSIEVEDEAGVRHRAGDLLFDVDSRKWYYLGNKGDGVDGKEKGDRVGATTNYKQAMKNLLEDAFPDAWDWETDWDRVLGDEEEEE